MKRCLIPTLAFLLFVSISHAQTPTYQIAVTPYANIGADKTADYIGFQIAEFLSSAMAGFPGVQVIERTQLMKILEEQELQLSGLTDDKGSVSIGQILNARQMVVGSFELSKTRLAVNGRIVDVQSGAVLSLASIETPVADSYIEAYKAFMFRLLAGLPEYKLTIGVEARIANIQEQATVGADDYAKALAALYNKDDQAALDYLQKAIGATQVGFVGFGNAADRYVETLSRVRGSSRYAKMVQKQIETNKALMEQVEPLSIYRSTLKVIEERAEALLGPEAFVLAGDPAAAVEYDDGMVSTKVRLPKMAGVELKEGAKTALSSLFSLQEVVRLGKAGLLFAPAPAGKLLSKSIIDRDFNLSINASVSHAVQFISTKGEVLYELVSDPVPVVSLTSSTARFSSSTQAVYRTNSYREGWAVHADGSIEIQARALADLDTVRYVIKPEGATFESSFGLSSDLRWRSLITHAYRKYSIKVASEAEDTAPQFKDVVVTDSFFTTADTELGRVPVLPRNGRVAGVAHLTGVVYFADNAKDAITATWTGAVSGASKPFVGELGPNTVLYFESPNDYAMRYGELEFTARLGQSPTGKIARTTLTNGSSWYTGNSVQSLILGGEMAYTAAGEAFSITDGLRAWDADVSAYELFLVDSSIILLHDRGLIYLDATTGAVQKKLDFNFRTIYTATLVSGKIYVQCYNGLIALDAASGVQLWSVRDDSTTGFAVVFGRVYNSSGSVYDASTGTKLFGTEGRGAVSVTGDKAFWANGLCTDRETGKTLWKYFNPGQRSSWSSGFTLGSPVCAGEIVYFGTWAAVRIKDGTAVWNSKEGMEQAILHAGQLYGWNSKSIAAYDPATGNRLWYIASMPSSTAPRAFKYEDGALFTSFESTGFTRIDLSVFEKELSAEEMTNRARLGIYSQTMQGDSGVKKGTMITNIVTGEAAEYAGMLPGDYIKTLNGHSIVSVEHLSDCLFQLTKGKRVPVSIERLDAKSGKWLQMNLTIPLGGADGASKPAIVRPGFAAGPITSQELRTRTIDSFSRDALMIDYVIEGSPAASAGMLAGDVLAGIGAVDLQRVYYISEAYLELTRALSTAMRTKSTLAFTVFRNGVKKTLPAFKP